MLVFTWIQYLFYMNALLVYSNALYVYMLLPTYLATLSELIIWRHCHNYSYLATLSELFIRRHCQIHLHGDIVMATLLYLPLYSGIAILVFESWFKYYFQLHKTISYLAVGCKHTGCKSCYGQGLELGGFTMPLLGIPHSKAIHFFSLNSMNSPTSCWHFSMYFQVFSYGTLLEVLAGHGMVIEDSDIQMGTVLNYKF